MFVLAPLVLLLLYPVSFFQRCLSACRLRSHMLQTFVDAFQGHYKDGAEPGTRDYRWFAAVYFLGRIIVLHVIFGITQDVLCYGMTGIFLLLVALVTVMLQPYKSNKVNNYHTSMQLIFAIACFLITLLDLAAIKDHWLIYTLGDLHDWNTVLWKPRRALRSFAELAPKSRRTRYFHASPKSSPKLRRTHSEASPMLRRTQLRYFADASPDSAPILHRCFAGLSSDTSPKSPPKLRRTQLRYFAEVTSEASPKFSSRYFIVLALLHA